jgi:hypothetical protein
MDNLYAEFSPLCGLICVIIGNTPSIAAAVIDSLPAELSYFLVGPIAVKFLRAPTRCRAYLMNDLSREESSKADFVRTIQLISSAHSNLILIPVDDSANRIVQSTFDRLGPGSYPMPESSSFEMLSDKWRFNQHCSNLGVRVPKTILLNGKAEIDFENVRAAVGLPFVLKPTNKSNSLGVQIIRSKENLQKQILSNRKYDFSPLIAQSFIPGVDIDISAFADRGQIKNFAIQLRKENMLCFVKNEQLLAMAEAVLRDLCYTGVIHIDGRLGDISADIFLIEANPRFWGSLAEATSGGLNFVQAGIYNCMGLAGPDPVTISDVDVPSTRRILTEIATLRRSYLGLPTQERLRLKRAMHSYVRLMLHPSLPELPTFLAKLTSHQAG